MERPVELPLGRRHPKGWVEGQGARASGRGGDVACPSYRLLVEFEVVTDITDVEVIARGVSVRQRARLNRLYGRGRWRKMKGFALVELISTRRQRAAELHWFEAHGIGARERKIKKFLD